MLCTNAVLLPSKDGVFDFACTPWGVPSYSLPGWQRPCYLLADGYAQTYAELLETTGWENFGRGQDPRCATAWRTAATSQVPCWSP